ncbi:dihydropyrimidinase [Anaerocolumna cellulosilytica]|uniref:Dihydropyrimidinase n=1 Tax=Anaerocolumna cellulosilytica TaxID=433286 RepID=A0A6S6R4T7_9FIRM|nr:dihydropyrimidinase [Anaerocolumna cellulosilytica]MBB5196406.1 dihydropyrimidinase [Anaerocolumna cellulosilytica]BCJ94472.1 dihydropyrimidinase [Anaerocolumna cellulosilytica]
MDLLIKNGTLINSKENSRADIAVENGKITAIGKDLQAKEKTEIVDAAGKLVLPGAIDVHTHLAMPFGGTISADGYFSGTRAAACGGTTTVFDFALQDFNENLVDTVKRRDALAAPEAAVDYAFHVGVKDVHGDLLNSMTEAVAYGVPSFKVFMVYDFGVTDGVFYQILEKAKECGALISVHAENKEIINVLTERYLSQGKTSAWYHYKSRPEFVEAEADYRAIKWAKSLNTSLYIVHLANKEGVEMVTRAKEEGYEIYAETCPQYLHFTKEVYKREDGRNFVCSPPIKGAESKDALWEAIKRGDIDTIATDHCPFQSYEKDWGKDDFTKIPNGCAAIENMYPYMLAAANAGKISFQKAVELCCENPARIFGCQEKGFLSVGKDADIVIYDTNKDFTITCESMHSDYDHTIWEGLNLHGYPVQTYSRGRLVYDKGEFVGEAGWGKLVKRVPRVTS